MEGWIKLHRVLLDSFAFAHPTTLKIWVWILLKANHCKKYTTIQIGFGIEQITLNPGQLLFGRAKAEEELCIDGSTIYKHLQKLKNEGNILIESNNHYTVITICNWDTYQGEEKDEVTARKQHVNNSTVTARETPVNSTDTDTKILPEKAQKEQPSNNQVTTAQQPSNTNNNVNNVNNKKEQKNPALPLEGTPDFSQLEKKYPAQWKFYKDQVAYAETQYYIEPKKVKPEDAPFVTNLSDKQITLRKKHHQIKNYKEFVNTLFVKNSLKKPADKLLIIPNQVTFEEFYILRQEAKEKGQDMNYFIELLINNPSYVKGRESLSITINQYIDKYKS